VAMPIFQRPGSNAIELSNQVRGLMAALSEDFPQGLEYDVVYDPTIFVRGSIDAVVHTLLEAILLVVFVVVLFLQTWRASIIPLVAVPVSLIGTFAAMQWLGVSINILSLFGLVLAIGIVVDDAIVVVENVERNIADGLTPIKATEQAMREVTGPIIAIALVLCAVFIPTAFITGLSGQFYKQFALTISISTVISAASGITLAAPGVSVRLPMFQTVSGPASAGNVSSNPFDRPIATAPASRRIAIGTVPAWPACPSTCSRKRLMPTMAVTTPIRVSMASRRGPCSICASRKAR